MLTWVTESIFKRHVSAFNFFPHSPPTNFANFLTTFPSPTIIPHTCAIWPTPLAFPQLPYEFYFSTYNFYPTVFPLPNLFPDFSTISPHSPKTFPTPLPLSPLPYLFPHCLTIFSNSFTTSISALFFSHTPLRFRTTPLPLRPTR